MTEVRATSEGLLLPVQAQPGARKNAVVGTHAGRLKVAVGQPPEKGKANDAVIEVVAGVLGLSRSQITLVRGAASRKKELLVRGLSLEQLQERLAKLLFS